MDIRLMSVVVGCLAMSDVAPTTAAACLESGRMEKVTYADIQILDATRELQIENVGFSGILKVGSCVTLVAEVSAGKQIVRDAIVTEIHDERPRTDPPPASHSRLVTVRMRLINGQ